LNPWATLQAVAKKLDWRGAFLCAHRSHVLNTLGVRYVCGMRIKRIKRIKVGVFP